MAICKSRINKKIKAYREQRGESEKEPAKKALKEFEYDSEDCPCGFSTRCKKCGEWQQHNCFSECDGDPEVCDYCKETGDYE